MRTRILSLTAALMLSFPACGTSETHRVENYFANGQALEFSVNEGRVRVLSYPTRWDGSLKVLQFPVTGIYKDLTPETCKAVEQRAAQYGRSPQFLKERIRNTLRKSNPVLVRMSVTENLLPDRILQAVRANLQKQGVAPAHLTLVNPIQVKETTITLGAAPDAISQTLGELDTLEGTLNQHFGLGIQHNGWVTGQWMAMDVLCDLSRGKVQLSMELEGSQVNASVPRALFEERIARDMHERMQEDGTMEDGGDPVTFGRNRVRAAFWVMSTLAETGRANLSADNLVHVVEALTDPKGVAPNDSQVNWPAATTVYEIQDAPFEAQTPIRLEVENEN